MTKPFTAYNPETGEVLYQGVADDPPALATVDTAIAAGIAPPNTYRSGDAWVAMPAQPSPHHEFDWATKQWIDPRTLRDLQDAKWEEMKIIRSQLEFLPFEWDGSWFDADLPRLMGAALRGKDTVWTLADNSLRFMTGPEIYAAAQALGDRTDQIFERSRMLRTMIYDTKDPQKIAEINWDSPLAELT